MEINSIELIITNLMCNMLLIYFLFSVLYYFVRRDSKNLYKGYKSLTRDFIPLNLVLLKDVYLIIIDYPIRGVVFCFLRLLRISNCMSL